MGVHLETRRAVREERTHRKQRVAELATFVRAEFHLWVLGETSRR